MKLRLWAIVAASAVAGCQGTEPEGPVAGIVVYGQVLGASDAPVSGAFVGVVARATSTCGGATLDADTDNSASDGSYHTILVQPGDSFQVCVRAAATPPAGLGVVADSVQLFPVIMRQTVDSVRLDIRLAPAP
jgi:hypothetical protein